MLRINEKNEIIINNNEEVITGSLMDKIAEKLCSKKVILLKIKLSGKSDCPVVIANIG